MFLLYFLDKMCVCVHFFPMVLMQTQQWFCGAAAISLKFDQVDSMLKTDTLTKKHEHSAPATLSSPLYGHLF